MTLNRRFPAVAMEGVSCDSCFYRWIVCTVWTMVPLIGASNDVQQATNNLLGQVPGTPGFDAAVFELGVALTQAASAVHDAVEGQEECDNDQDECRMTCDPEPAIVGGFLDPLSGITSVDSVLGSRQFGDLSTWVLQSVRMARSRFGSVPGSTGTTVPGVGGA
jgi:hypothetical protein